MTSFRVSILSAHGTVLTEKQDYAPTLEQMQGAVGGFIELVPQFNKFEGQSCIAFCNENGKLEGLEFNAYATQVWWNQAPQFIEQDVLVGDVIVISGDAERLKEI